MTCTASATTCSQQPVVTFFVVGIMAVVTTPKALNGGKDWHDKRDTADLFIFLCIGLACVVFIGIVLSGYLLGQFYKRYDVEHVGHILKNVSLTYTVYVQQGGVAQS